MFFVCSSKKELLLSFFRFVIATDFCFDFLCLKSQGFGHCRFWCSFALLSRLSIGDSVVKQPLDLGALSLSRSINDHVWVSLSPFWDTLSFLFVFHQLLLLSTKANICFTTRTTGVAKCLWLCHISDCFVGQQLMMMAMAKLARIINFSLFVDDNMNLLNLKLVLTSCCQEWWSLFFGDVCLHSIVYSLECVCCCCCCLYLAHTACVNRTQRMRTDNCTLASLNTHISLSLELHFDVPPIRHASSTGVADGVPSSSPPLPHLTLPYLKTVQNSFPFLLHSLLVQKGAVTRSGQAPD